MAEGPEPEPDAAALVTFAADWVKVEVTEVEDTGTDDIVDVVVDVVVCIVEDEVFEDVVEVVDVVAALTFLPPQTFEFDCPVLRVLFR